ncbi:MAG: alpha-L-rhamnosidase C-terminal domain-containing protein [bacterium]
MTNSACSSLPAVQDAVLWPETSKFVVLETKPEVWTAHWLDAGPEIHDDAMGRVFYLRKQFTTEDPQAFKRVYVSADSKYKMWINGRPAARGPQLFDPNHQVYDTLDLSSLIVRGVNLIAVQIIYWGDQSRDSPFFQFSAHPAFVLESKELKSDDSWKAMPCPGSDGAGRMGLRKDIGMFSGMAGNWLEKVDARLLPVGWNRLEYDDSNWTPARKLDRMGPAETWGEKKDTDSPWKMVPRTVPPLEEEQPQSCRVIQAGMVNDQKDLPPFSLDVTPSCEVPSLPCTIPADGKIHYLIFQSEKLVTAYMQLLMEGGEGSVVEVLYTEAPSLNCIRDRRDVLDDKRLEGHNDIYITRGGPQVFEPFLYRAFWYVRVAVKAVKPLTIRSLTYRWTGYPFEKRGSFSCSDPVLNRIWEVGWYTLRCCSHDTFEDCPYFERLQYAGDVRITGLVSYYASGDPRLMRNAIRQLHASRIPEGLTMSRYPNHVYQVIPGYSLLWLMCVEDYYLHTGDLEIVRECASGIYSVLRFFEGYQTDFGLLANLPFWNFFDWTFENSGVPPGFNENCTLSTMLYKGALDAGVRLFEAMGDSLEAERFRRRSKAVCESINRHAWNEKEGLYTDGVATQSLSQHANIYAILFGVADETRRARIASRLFDDPALRSTTFYFAHYLHEIAEQLGQPQRILDDMARWKHMLDKGTTTWWEEPGKSRSECHAWSATPTYRLMSLVLGVRPLEPGFKRTEIRPYPGGLEWAKGTVPTPYGEIKVNWNREPAFVVEVSVPEGIEADVILPGGASHTAAPGTHRFVEGKE